MKKFFKLIDIIALVVVIGFSFAACGGGGGGGDPISEHLNGTWEASDGESITLNNGSFLFSEDDKPSMKGTYTAAARSISATVTMAVKELHGDLLNNAFEEEDIDVTFENKWYNKNQVIDAFKKWMKDKGASDKDISDTISGNSADFDDMFPTMTGIVNDNTMTFEDGTTFTKNGGSGGVSSAPIITTAFLPNGTVGMAYSQTLTAIGETPITWNIASGTLPTGLTIGTTGVISGTPTTAGSFSFTVKATNAKGNDTMPLNITIAAGVTDGNGGWTAISDKKFKSNEIEVIVYGNGKFVAGGHDNFDYFGGKIAYSSDGLSWTTVNVNNIFNQGGVIAIACGDDKFVAGGWDNDGTGKIAYSSDGATWTNANVSNIEDITAIAYGGGRFVAGGQNGKIVTSTDGVSWTAAANSTFGSTEIQAIAYGDNKFVALGSGGKMATSTNGTTWTSASISSIFGGSINGITYGGDKFVVVGWDNHDDICKIAYSSDGVSWTAVTNTTFGEDDINAIAYGSGKFVAVGGKNKIATSTNGVTWTAVTTTVFDYVVGSMTIKAGINAIAYGNGKFVACNGDGVMAYSTGN